MDRSPRFRVCPHVLHALFRLAFAPAPALKALTSHVRSNSPDHNAKGTRSPADHPEGRPQAPTACMHTVSGSLSLAVRRSFHRSLTVLSTIGHRFVFSLGGWSPQLRPGFLVPRPTRASRHPPTRVSHTGLSPPPVRRSRRVPLRFQKASAVTPQPRPPARATGLGSSPFARRYSENLDLISLPPGTEMFQFPGFALLKKGVTDGLPSAGFPHSDIPGSSLACSSPRLFAACHVLPRRSVPRHPPCALSRLTSR